MIDVMGGRIDLLRAQVTTSPQRRVDSATCLKCKRPARKAAEHADLRVERNQCA